jgi:hypothetical protein
MGFCRVVVLGLGAVCRRRGSSRVYLVQILLPLFDNGGASFPPESYRRVQEELSQRYGGLTAFTRAPAEGHWLSDGKKSQDEIVVFEVMTEQLGRYWWAAYRRELETLFRQDQIVIRAQPIQLL